MTRIDEAMTVCVIMAYAAKLQAALESNICLCCKLPKHQEKIGSVEVETYTRNYWFLDGSIVLDGSRKLNSRYEKENVE